MGDQSIVYEGILCRPGSEGPHKVPVTVIKERDDGKTIRGISIRLDGYETATGVGDPIIYIELDKGGSPVLYAWLDINNQLPTFLSLSGAHVDLREWIDSSDEQD